MPIMLWTADYDAEWEKTFSKIVDVRRAGFNLHGRINDYLGEDALIEALQGCDILCVAYDKVTRRVLENCPDLKLILSVRDGPEENIDVNACAELGIPVLGSAGRCTVSVAEFTFALMLNMARPIITLTNTIRRDGWTKENGRSLRSIVTSGSTELCGKTLGIVGLGRNAQRLTKYALAFDMNVVAYDPYLPEEKADELGVTLMDLDEVMAVGDYIAVLARATSQNHNLISRAQFEKMKSTCAFINTARASLVDTSALLDALRTEKIRMAAVDVFDHEFIPDKDPYYDIPPEKLILTNHVAGFSQERTAHQYAIGMENLTKFLHGECIRNNCARGSESAKGFAQRGGKLYGFIK